MLRGTDRPENTINASSMADIAFLLLIFFLVVTTLSVNKGLNVQLPPDADQTEVVRIKNRNLFKILINSKNQFLIQNEPRDDLKGLRLEIKEFILNKEGDPGLPESSQKAIISLKTSRKTGYGTFIVLLDELKGAYYEIYAEHAGMTEDQFRSLDLNDPFQKEIYINARMGIPMNISIAEPDKLK